MNEFDFSGMATKNDLLCSDGRIIRKDAFKDCDGKKVPLVWNHQHNDPFNVLGYALLHNCENGVRADCYLNKETSQGKNAAELVKHGDVFGLSIYADQLKQNMNDVMHGDIKEVSLVLAGANPGAFIDSISFAHGEDSEEEAVIYTGEELIISHSATEEKKEEKPMAEVEEKKQEKKQTEDKSDKTVGDVFEAAMKKLDKDEQDVIYAVIGEAAGGEDKDDDEGGSDTMKHNVFEDEGQEMNVLSHSDFNEILADAKRCGSLREAVNNAMDGGVLAHSIDTTGMEVATGTQTYGFNDPSMLFPEYKSLNNPPEWISRKMDWVTKVMSGVHHTPFSRIKSVYANITEDDARAKGYLKGHMKKDEVFTTLKRTTDPQTVYKKQKLDRDDIIEITDFDVVAWIRAEMRVMLNEELARAFLVGDGRNPSSDDKIQELHVRPIMNDVPLFNTKVRVSVPSNATGEEKAKAAINAVIRSRKNYKGSGNPTLYTTEDWLTEMLLIEDGIGHKLYKTESELATALRVKEIVTVEPMENVNVTVGNDTLPLIGIIVNLTDYNVGADKGGEINMFDDFDIDLNQYKYLIETRISGALVKPFSALTLALDVAAGNNSDDGNNDSGDDSNDDEPIGG